jgi:hypothetical protein
VRYRYTIVSATTKSVTYDKADELLMTVSGKLLSGTEVAHQLSIVLPEPSDGVD